jgi:hypothetical protein
VRKHRKTLQGIRCFSLDYKREPHRIKVGLVTLELNSTTYKASSYFYVRSDADLSSDSSNYINLIITLLFMCIGNYIFGLHIVTNWAVTRRRVGKHFPTNPHPIIEGRPQQRLRNNREIIFYGSAPRSYLEDNWRCRCQLRVHLWSVNQRATEEE